MDPFLNPPPPPPPSTCIDEADFDSLYAAAEFAEMHGTWFDTTISITWSLMGPKFEADIATYFNKFTKCVRDWLTQRHSPTAWIYCHERGNKVGLHTHMALYVPGSFPTSPSKPNKRTEFKKWAREWVTRQVGHPVPRAIRVHGPRVETPWLHWLTFSYLCKGFDKSVVVQSAKDSPDGRDVMLGDLIAFHWHDPGHVPLKQRVGTSRSLGPDARAVGVANMSPYREHHALLGAPPLRHVGSELVGNPAFIMREPPPPFRSRYENGARDVRRLYGADFYERVSRVEAYPRQPRPAGLLTFQEWFDLYNSISI